MRVATVVSVCTCSLKNKKKKNLPAWFLTFLFFFFFFNNQTASAHVSTTELFHSFSFVTTAADTDLFESLAGKVLELSRVCDLALPLVLELLPLVLQVCGDAPTGGRKDGQDTMRHASGGFFFLQYK